MDKALILAACLLLSGCTLSPSPILYRGIPCSVGPIILDPADKLTRPTAEQVVTLNESGAELCDWKPPTK